MEYGNLSAQPITPCKAPRARNVARGMPAKVEQRRKMANDRAESWSAAGGADRWSWSWSWHRSARGDGWRETRGAGDSWWEAPSSWSSSRWPAQEGPEDAGASDETALMDRAPVTLARRPATFAATPTHIAPDSFLATPALAKPDESENDLSRSEGRETAEPEDEFANLVVSGEAIARLLGEGWRPRRDAAALRNATSALGSTYVVSCVGLDAQDFNVASFVGEYSEQGGNHERKGTPPSWANRCPFWMWRRFGWLKEPRGSGSAALEGPPHKKQKVALERSSSQSSIS
eukprot:TRINITY_DN65955_c0_g1_i1.p1 TRINITY_DN65955_c0_g1~~TRINITY_DN65955_c0_g1_i1.p1  ORF type:complete len:289 (-),score=55.77 TRINITY_DN65955_c0_g1_i1:168-1034(-)